MEKQSECVSQFPSADACPHADDRLRGTAMLGRLEQLAASADLSTIKLERESPSRNLVRSWRITREDKLLVTVQMTKDIEFQLTDEVARNLGCDVPFDRLVGWMSRCVDAVQNPPAIGDEVASADSL